MVSVQHSSWLINSAKINPTPRRGPIQKATPVGKPKTKVTKLGVCVRDKVVAEKGGGVKMNRDRIPVGSPEGKRGIKFIVS